MSDLISVAAVIGLFVSVSNAALTYPNWFFGKDYVKIASKKEKWLTPIMLALYLIFAYLTYGYIKPVEPKFIGWFSINYHYCN
jgi:hypothetical protein